jgi:hypothetical protein
LAPLLSAVIDVEKEYHGKRVSCLYSGLRGVARSCGTEGYARVFTGTVRSSTEVGDTDKLLEIEPDEVFLGDFKPVKAVTNQACLNSEIQTGDKWLFYLVRDGEGKTLVSPYDGSSKPLTAAEDDISMLRQLVRLTESGMLVGKVDLLKGRKDGESNPLANHEVIANNVKGGIKYTTYTNENGYFQFELPPGSYDLSAAPEYALEEVETFGSMLRGSVPVEKGKCWEHDFTVKNRDRDKVSEPRTR